MVALADPILSTTLGISVVRDFEEIHFTWQFTLLNFKNI